MNLLCAHTVNRSPKLWLSGFKSDWCVRTRTAKPWGFLHSHSKAVLHTTAAASFRGRLEQQRVRSIKGGASVELITGIEHKTSTGICTTKVDRTPVIRAGQTECNPSGNVGIFSLGTGIYIGCKAYALAYPK